MLVRPVLLSLEPEDSILMFHLTLRISHIFISDEKKQSSPQIRHDLQTHHSLSGRRFQVKQKIDKQFKRSVTSHCLGY
jgi:D-ribose pyranose/furanose isomerase RbsD